ncbi:hypothetical protein AYK25_10195 [Thermoplasmatales archaeon SM1-50]|nr:MAG: hypothetical protein AYK25_10195 [Thermoplasmatales archaeon SM1-50]
MKVKVHISRTKKIEEIDIDTGTTVEHILKKINLKPDTVIVMKKDKPIPIVDEIKDGEELKIIHVSSGG